ncbi:hypothetical protein AVEN_198539-1 [Araneus ventricosus]|uniref:Uncharacterized protein n=1 Tax=Araneus ventricosus TaxID=182803 RepID=A0A4Y2HX67_ARAVE|nr:hypothetical protein AVEN_198539-1 [Araneus ventricosus]
MDLLPFLYKEIPSLWYAYPWEWPTGGGGTINTWMRSSQINKRDLASLVGAIMVGAWPLPERVLVRKTVLRIIRAYVPIIVGVRKAYYELTTIGTF